MKRGMAMGVVVAVMVGCSSGGGDWAHGASASPVLNEDQWDPIIWEFKDGPADVGRLDNCGERAFEQSVRGPWSAVENLYLAAQRSPEHRASDWVIGAEETATVGVVVDYEGTPLVEEGVRLYIDDCQGWQHLGVERSDEDGVVRFDMGDEMEPGIYGLAFQVLGDGSVVQSQLWVLPEATEAMVVAWDQIQDRRADLRSGVARGALPVYRGSDAGDGGTLNERRRALRQEGFPVGPVIDDGLQEKIDERAKGGLKGAGRTR